MKSEFDKMTEEEEGRIALLTEKILANGPVELEASIDILDSTITLEMPSQIETEEAMERAGMDSKGRIRDASTRDLIFARLILERAIVEIDDVEMTRAMSRKFLSAIQPPVISAIFMRFADIRQQQSIIIRKTLETAKKLPPDPATD